MEKCYIDDLLDGIKTYDARKCKTNYRGTVALVQLYKNLIYGYIDIVDCKRITYKEFLEWHGIDYEKESYIYKLCRIKMPNSECYAYVMTNPIRLKEPIRIYKKINQHMWFDYNESDLIEPEKKEEKEPYNLFNMDDI